MSLRIIVLTQSAPVYLAPFLDDTIGRILGNGHEIISVVSMPPFFKKSRLAELRERYEFYGITAFARMVGFILLTKLRAQVDPTQSLAGVLKKYQLTEKSVSNVNAPEFIEYLQAQETDLLVSIAFPKILKTPILEAPRLGCINYHTALLPDYRGRQPLFWALYHNESEVGISVHEMNAGIDSGAIIEQTRLDVLPTDSLHNLYLKTTKHGAPLLAEAIQKLAKGDPARIENDPEVGSYFSFPNAEQARQFRLSGKRFFGSG